jgi:putative spermidine/putrescine transport system substrate-binding protein
MSDKRDTRTQPVAGEGCISRRKFLSMGIGALAASQIPAPVIFARSRPRLRVLGTHVTLREEIKKKAQEDLGIDLSFYPGGDPQILHQASTRPDSFDVYEQWSNSIKVLWRAGSIQPIDIRRLQYWNEINGLSKTGRLTPGARIGAGDAPHRILFVQPDGKLGPEASRQISFLPYVHNTDSFGYNTHRIARGIPYVTESWAWLLDDQYRGKVALINEPSIGIFDAALAARAKGLIEFADIGNMTRDEIDRLIEILLAYKKKGHFRGFWSSVPRSVDLMANGEVDIESMFSPAVSDLNGRGIPCVYAAPREGYRAWQGVMCLSQNASGRVRDAAYEYMNWWLSGWPGAFIARQGYYISNPQRSRPLMKPEEWDYWYEGKPAAIPLCGTDGKISVRKGDVRTGGSYTKRFENVAVWNTVMDQYEYLLLRWKELLLG